MNTPEEEYITYIVVDQSNANSMQNQKRVKIMNTPDEERITYSAVEPAKAGLMQSTNKSQLAGGDIGGSGNLDKVRDILFGNQMRDYEKRFTRLEDRLVKECVNLRSETRKSLESLEMYIKNEVESLTESLKNQQVEQEQAVEGLAQDLKETTKSLEKKIAQLDEQTTQKQRDLRQQILDQSKSLNDEMRQKYEAILSLVQREIGQLSYEKTDRSTLAALFTQLAMQLNNEFEIPGNE